MNCKQGTDLIIGQMTDLLAKIPNDNYTSPLALFNGSSIGQHFRHIFDFYNCLCRDASVGRVDYAKRERDVLIEANPAHAGLHFEELRLRCANLNETASIEVVADFSAEPNEERPVVQSTLARELMYAYDHAVHHLAMIKMGLKAINPAIEVDKNIGVAPSTVKHWQHCFN